MPMIQAEGLAFSYPGSPDPVFQDAAFQIDTSWRLGLIGRNGQGKTTLLRLLTGEYPHEGVLSSPGRFDYFPHPVPEPERLAALLLREGFFPLVDEPTNHLDARGGKPSPPTSGGSGALSWSPTTGGSWTAAWTTF